ncbi:MAG TPA: hypothetical protein VFV00_20080, partial [Acidimicrobiales bacterium]|nr:hypothetical protein [Acidimicrobiales bacterium]
DNPIGGRIGPGGNPIVFVSSPGTDPSGNAGGSGTVTCGLYSGDTSNSGVWIGTGTEVTAPTEGESYWIVCTDGYVNRIVYDPANAIDPATLARRAFNELPLIYPRPRTAPPATAKQLVGIRTWLWVDPGDWHAMSASAAIPGLSASVTAQPTRTIWEMGDGSTVTCDGPGTPYDATRPDAAQSTDCSHVYQHDGTYNVLATIEWTVTWSATNGAGGNLGAVRRSTQFPLTVEQRQAVISG